MIVVESEKLSKSLQQQHMKLTEQLSLLAAPPRPQDKLVSAEPEAGRPRALQNQFGLWEGVEHQECQMRVPASYAAVLQ